MRTDPGPFWTNLYLYNFESKYTSNLIRTNKLGGRQFYGASLICD